MTREQKYAEQMKAIGIYKAAFEPAIHTLAIMEREHQRTLKAWKAEGGEPTSKLYGIIAQQRRDILSHRDALGLTPQAMRRLKPVIAADREPDRPEQSQTVLSIVREKHARYA